LSSKIKKKGATDVQRYFYIIVQSKRKASSNKTEDISPEWNKICLNDAEDCPTDKFFKQHVAFLLVSDGDRINDSQNKQAAFPKNIFAIPKGQYGAYFGSTFAVLKELKSYPEEAEAKKQARKKRKNFYTRSEADEAANAERDVGISDNEEEEEVELSEDQREQLETGVGSSSTFMKHWRKRKK